MDYYKKYIKYKHKYLTLKNKNKLHTGGIVLDIDNKNKYSRIDKYQKMYDRVYMH